MRICQVLPEFFMGGAEAMCITLSAELKKMGHDVCIVSLRTYESALTERARSYGIEILFMDKQLGLDLSCIPRLRKFFRSWKPDVIHTHLHALKYAYSASLGMGIPHVHTIHCNVSNHASCMDTITLPIYRYLFSHKKVTLVSLSEKICAITAKHYNISAKDSPIVFNGVDLTRCISKQTYDNPGTLRLIQVASLSRWKNPKASVECVRILKQRGADVSLDFFGEGAERPELEKMIAQYGLQEQITLHGVSGNVFPELQKSDIFILPSFTEGSPISIIEAMGTGLPVIASNVGGIPDMITDGVDGILIEPNAQALADAIEKLLTDEALRKALGENAKESVNRFSSVTMAEEYLKLYTKLIG